MTTPPRRLLPLAVSVALLCCLSAPTAAAAPGSPPPAAGCALPGRTGWTDEGHDTDRTQFQPATGVRRVLTLYVDFPDAPATESTE
ncbi:peptidase M6, partial [Streptomyces sp. NPDC032472]